MTGHAARLARFVEGAAATAIWSGESAAESMRADVRAALSVALTWSSDWNALQLDEEVLLAVLDVRSRHTARVLARLHRMVTQPPRGALAHRRRGGDDWTVWQSTWDGAPLPDTFRPYAFARPVPPEPEEDA